MINELGFRIKKNGEPDSVCLCAKPELIENYEKAIADKERTWICHHKKEEFYTSQELKDLSIYYNVLPEDLVFVRDEKEHKSWPHKGREEGYRKMSESLKGRPSPKRGKPRNFYSRGSKGMHWYNNGNISTLAFDCPDGYVPGRLKH